MLIIILLSEMNVLVTWYRHFRFSQGCREKFLVGGEDGRETEISADKYAIYAAPKALPHSDSE